MDLLVIESSLEKNITASLLEVSLDKAERIIQEMHALYSGFKGRLSKAMALKTYPTYPGTRLMDISKWLAEFDGGTTSGGLSLLQVGASLTQNYDLTQGITD